MIRKTMLFFVLALSMSLNVASQDPARSPAEVINRSPDIEKLLALIDRADHIVVTNVTGGKQTQLFESRQANDIKDFRNALSLKVPDEWFYSICGGPEIDLYRNEERLVHITNIVSRSITTSLWEGDVLIADTERWLNWFDSRKLTQVRVEFERETANGKKRDEDEARWYGAMPRGIKEPFEKQVSLIGLPSMYDTDPFRPILQREYPDKNVRVLAVLHWYGSGEGHWSGYPGYESIAENILFMFTTAEIIEAINTRKLSVTETEGAARLFAGWDYHQKRPSDLKLISTILKQQFLTHAMKSNDEDKRDRARAAFGNK